MALHHLQVVTYAPISPFLNTFCFTLDGVFPLFRTVAFTVFCFYLIGEHPRLQIMPWRDLPLCSA